LPYRPIILAISKVTRLLLKHLTLNNNNYLNVLEKSLFTLKLYLTALSLHVLKSKLLSNIFLTLICEVLDIADKVLGVRSSKPIGKH
jgi:hypothetical protein